MDYRAKIEIDVQDAFDELQRKEQEEFIKSNLSVFDTDDLIEVIESQGYKVIDKSYGLFRSIEIIETRRNNQKGKLERNKTHCTGIWL